MGTGNCEQEELNSPQTFERLTAGDGDAWDLMLQYVREKVTFRLLKRPLPDVRTRQQWIDDSTSDACTHIIENLMAFEQKGLLTAYLDTIIRSAVGDPNFKNYLQASARLVEAPHRLSATRLHELLVFVERLPQAQCQILLAHMCKAAYKLCEADQHRELLAFVERRTPKEREMLVPLLVHGKEFPPSVSASAYLWQIARHELVREPRFVAFLSELAREGYHLAGTVLFWYRALEGVQSWPLPPLDGEDDSGWTEPPDNGPLPNEIQEAHERAQLILKALESLHQYSKNLHQAIYLRYCCELSVDAIAERLHITPANVRKRISRGLKYLRDYLGPYFGDLLN